MAKKKTTTERPIASFSKDVLVAYLKSEVFINHAMLRLLELEIDFKKLETAIRAIHQEIEKAYKENNRVKYLKLQIQETRLQKRMDRLLKLD